MKKNLFNIRMALFVSTVALSAFIYSCSKEEAKPLSPANHQVSLSNARYTASTNVANPDNPYDNIGVAHNDGLDYALDHRAEWTCDEASMTDKAVELTSQFCCDNGYGLPGDCPNATASAIRNAYDTYRSSDINAIIANSGSTMLQGYLHQLFDDINSYTDSTQVDSLLASIKSLESGVNASTLNPDEKQLFLGASSIARYSADYWFQETQKAESPWVHYDNNHNPIPAGKYNWTKFWVVLGADVAGYIVGNVPGGIGFSTVFATI